MIAAQMMAWDRSADWLLVGCALVLLAWLVVAALMWRCSKTNRAVMGMDNDQLYRLGAWNAENQAVNIYALEFDRRIEFHREVMRRAAERDGVPTTRPSAQSHWMV